MERIFWTLRIDGIHIDFCVQCAAYVSGSSLWKVALEHVTEFESKKKEGTVFLVHSEKSGRYVGQYSQLPFDAEIIFPRQAKFRVRARYRGDVICLGQANIREHTFMIKDEEELEMYSKNQKSMIIELEEV
jgi:hypothetical protein